MALSKLDRINVLINAIGIYLQFKFTMNIFLHYLISGCRTSVKNTFCLKLANSSTRDNCLRNVLFTCLSNLQLNKVTSSCQSVPLGQRAYIISEIILGRTHKCP